MSSTSTTSATESPTSPVYQTGSRVVAWGADAPSAAPPVAAPAAVGTAVVIALVLLGLGVVGIRDGLTAAGALSGSLWTVQAAEAVSGSTPTPWVLAGAIIAVLLGFWFVVSALRPRAATGLQVSAQSSVWITPRDAARLAIGSVAQVPGVTGASAQAGRRKVVITAAGEAGDTDLTAVQAAAATALAGLEKAPTVRVRAKAPRGTRSGS